MSSVSVVKSAQGEAIAVEMAEVRVSARLTDNLVAYGLGACIGICIYDPSLKVAGMAYIVMPEHQRYAAATGEMAAATSSHGKFADTAIPLLVEGVCHAGGQRKNLRAAYAGGASIFGGMQGGAAGLPSGLEIGERNAVAVEKVLKSLDIPVHASDVGGSYGRTLLFRVCDGAVVIKPIGGQGRILAILSKSQGEGSNERRAA